MLWCRIFIFGEEEMDSILLVAGEGGGGIVS